MHKYFNLVVATTFCGVYMPLASGSPQQYPVPSSSDQVQYIEKTFLTFDGLVLHGHLAVPRNLHSKPPVVMLLVGSGPGNRYEDVPGDMTSDGYPALLFRQIEDALIAKGMAVFTYDKRGVIPNDASFESNTVTADYQTATASNLASDAIAAFDVVGQFSEVNHSLIAVLGHSEGTVLALKVAEARPAVQTLLLLGVFTRGFDELSYFQSVTSNMRIMALVDADGDGYVREGELDPFHTESPTAFPSWSDLLSVMDYSGDGKVAQSEQRFYFESANRDFLEQISDNDAPWSRSTPRAWFQQYLAEGDFTVRFIEHCSKINVIHGEADAQTPFEDALNLRSACQESGRPLRSFVSFPDLGHAFSPRVGLRGWRDTIGPIEAPVLDRIADVAGMSLLN